MTKKASPLNASAITLPIIPEWFYHLFFVTPEWFYQGSTVFKTSGCLIKALRHDEKGMSPLNTSIAFFSSPRQSLSRGPWFLRISGFPPEFRNDEKEAAPLNGSITLRSSPRQFLSRF